jgi:transposase
MTHPLVHAVATAAALVQTPCRIRHVRWLQPTLPCDRCGSAARRVWEVARTAIDLDLDAPVLLRVAVSVQHCPACRHHFRAQPPFLRPDAVYTNRIVAKAVQAVFTDGLAFRRVPDRLARDFWVRPTEGMVRAWCRTYSMHVEGQESYLPWVVEEFSGILCVDEVSQGALGLLLAVDPAAPGGDRLVGYQLVDGSVDGAAVSAFLRRLKDAGICPEEVITDGSTLYPAVLADVWPTAAHQLCLCHETRHVTDAVRAVVSLARRALPPPPPRPRQGRGGPLSPVPPPPHPDDPATQQWQLRRARRHAEVSEVHAWARQGYSMRASAGHTGRNRRTIRAWLQPEIPVLAAETQAIAARVAAAGEDTLLRRRRLTPERQARLQELARQGLSHSAIARSTGLHRVTVSRWLRVGPTGAPEAIPDDQGLPAEDVTASATSATSTVAALPAPWTSWEQVWQVREALKEHRWLLLRHPEHLTAEQQEVVTGLVTGPLGDLLGVAHRFLLDWYALWRTEDGQRRPLAEAQERYECWRTSAEYQALAPLRKVQDLMTAARFTRLSQFLRQPHWEATNNGAERMGRAFRHGQAPHFRLRTTEAIDGALRVVSLQTKERAITPPTGRCASSPCRPRSARLRRPRRSPACARVGVMRAWRHQSPRLPEGAGWPASGAHRWQWAQRQFRSVRDPGAVSTRDQHADRPRANGRSAKALRASHADRFQTRLADCARNEAGRSVSAACPRVTRGIVD